MLIARSELPPLPIPGAIPRIGLLVIAAYGCRRLVARDPRTVVPADTHIRTTAGMSRIRIHSSRSTRADTRADVPCDERPQRFLE